MVIVALRESVPAVLQAEQLFEAVHAGDFERVRAIVESVRGFGVFPPRLSLLTATDGDGRRAEDVANERAVDSAVHRTIAEYLTRQRIQMEYFE